MASCIIEISKSVYTYFRPELMTLLVPNVASYIKNSTTTCTVTDFCISSHCDEHCDYQNPAASAVKKRPAAVASYIAS